MVYCKLVLQEKLNQKMAIAESLMSVLIAVIGENIFVQVNHHFRRRGGLMVSALDSGSSGPGAGPGRGHCVVFLGKTLYSHDAFLHPGV